MNVPLEISYRGVESSEYLDKAIRQGVAKLERHCDHLSSCRVAIERTQHHQRSGQRYRVRIDLTVPPRHELTVSREPSEGSLHTDLVAEIREAFDAAERQVKQLSARQHGDVKVHPQQETQAVVEEIDAGNDHGFARTLDGQRVYFHRHSVLHREFEQLSPGTGVRLRVHQGEKGLQASSVQITDKRPRV